MPQLVGLMLIKMHRCHHSLLLVVVTSLYVHFFSSKIVFAFNASEANCIIIVVNNMGARAKLQQRLFTTLHSVFVCFSISH